MTKTCRLFVIVCLALSAQAQNFTSVTASQIKNLSGNPLALGQICFLATDTYDQATSFQPGGGGQVISIPACAVISNGAIVPGFQVVNPANANPAGIVYRITVTNTLTGQTVLYYPQVSFSGSVFNLDNYAKNPVPTTLPPQGGTVNGPISVAGNLTVTGNFSLGALGSVLIGACRNLSGVRCADAFPGASIIEKIQAAVIDLAGPGMVFVPSGNYVTSSCATWQPDAQSGDPRPSTSGATTGVKIPSGVQIIGTGIGATNITLNRKNGDPPCFMFANANRTANTGNANIRISGMSLFWNDTSSAQSSGTSLIYLNDVDTSEVDHVFLQGNPNKMMEVTDSRRVDIHESTFMLMSTGFAFGDNAITFTTFANPVTPMSTPRFHHNYVAQNGGGGSYLLIAQDGVIVENNTFDALSFNAPGIRPGSCVETGTSNFLVNPRHFVIDSNRMVGCGLFPINGLDFRVSNNTIVDGPIFVTITSGNGNVTSHVTIVNNELTTRAEKGGGNITAAGDGRTGGVGVGDVEIANNDLNGGSIFVVSLPHVFVHNNRVRWSEGAGIDCNSCEAVQGNIVKDAGQAIPDRTFGDNGPNLGYHLSSRTGVPMVVQSNTYIDDQGAYSTGTICSADTAASTSCSSSQTHFLLLTGGAWSLSWGNRYLWTGTTRYRIEQFIDSTHLQLVVPVSVPSGTAYNLYRTTYDAAEITGTFAAFTGNIFYSATNWAARAIQEDAPVTQLAIANNIFFPYSCIRLSDALPCADYRMDTAATGGSFVMTFNAAGVIQLNTHAVSDRVSLTGGTATVTLSGSAAFSSNNSYNCSLTNQGSNDGLKIAYLDGSHFVITTSSQLSVSVGFNCVGD